MKLTTDEKGYITLQDVYSGIGFETGSGDRLSVAMRDSGYEVKYGGKLYAFKGGEARTFLGPPKGNEKYFGTVTYNVDVPAGTMPYAYNQGKKHEFPHATIQMHYFSQAGSFDEILTKHKQFLRNNRHCRPETTVIEVFRNGPQVKKVGNIWILT